MQTQQIISQLKAVLPKYTNAFTNNLTINSLSRFETEVTVLTDLAHNLNVGDKVLINGAKTAVSIQSLTSFDTYALAITTQQHNLTKFNQVTEVSGADQVNYNGTKTLIWKTPKVNVISIQISGNVATVLTSTPHGLNANSQLRFNIFGIQQDPYNQNNIQNTSVIDSTSFTYNVYGVTDNALPNLRTGLIQMQIELNANTFMFEVPSGEVSPATGTIFQLSMYQSGYNGYKTVTAISDITKFSYIITETPLSPAQGLPIAQTYPCIEGFITLKECSDHFQSGNNTSSQNWIYVVLDDENASKNIRTQGDSLSYGESGIAIREEADQNVNIYLYLANGINSGRNELSSANLRDLGYSFKPYIYRALLGFRPSSNLSDSFYSQLMSVNNGVQDYNGAILIYRYTFQATVWTNTDDAVAPSDISAFREFDFDVIDNFGYNESVMKIQGRVDDGN
tara:strand:- start:37028 stop:38383 length:1356 start_codon:yes stop_codon:yes gene_type:complete